MDVPPVSPLSEELNPQQWEAVWKTEGPLLVVAGAGSGKTRAITYRIIHMIRDKKISPENILAITFTNKAAREMRERVHQRLQADEGVPWVSTFHSMCLRLLRRHISELGYSNEFAIYDAQDQLSLIKKCMKSANVNEEAFNPRAILGHISGFKNDFLLPEQVNPDELSYGAKLKASFVYPEYQKALKENNALDFDDLLMMTVRLLTQVESVCNYYNNRFRYILVDEFQDTNLTQYRLIQLLAKTHHNVCVVGDDDQSIYRWRGANIDNIINFERDFPQTQVIKLEQNYRSTQTILRAAGAVVRENMTRKEKTLWTENEAGSPVHYCRAEDETDEAGIVCDRIDRWNQEDGYSFSDIAVLYRTNAQSRAIEDQLRHRNLPYQVIGGLKFYERREIKDVLAYMRVVINPADSVSLKRIVNLPVRGIGKTSLEKLEAWCSEKGVSLLEGLRQAGTSGAVGAGPAKKMSAFITLMDHLDTVHKQGGALDFLQEILDRTGYLAMLQKDNNPENRSRMENLNELYNAIEEFVDKEKKGTLQEFLDTTALVADQDAIEDSRGVLPLMTLHTCKGLEFDGVVIIGAENGLLPHASSMSSTEEYEEERRLCYVGFTRARKKLMVTNARRRRIYGNTFTYAPSDFLSAIPGELIEKEMSPATTVGSSSGYSDRYSSGGYSSSPSPLPSPPRSKEDKSNYVVGTKVLHPKFGNGVVVNKEGNEDDLKVTVFFKKAGKKKLAVSQANLIIL